MESDGIIISSRVRLARNVVNLPFPSRLNDERAFSIVAKGAVNAISGFKYDFFNIGQLSKIDRLALVERHLISIDLIKREQIGAVIISKDESVSVMINEEDHIRAQCIKTGYDLSGCYNIINAYDDRLAEFLPIAYDRELGYLTSCLTNLGTGMRASVMLFLPALTLTKRIRHVEKTLADSGITFRGVYGEGSAAAGAMYQISNKISLGITERQILSDVEDAVKYCVSQENIARIELAKVKDYALVDDVYRAYGILTNARILSSKEFMSYMAELKLGMALNIIKFNDIHKLNNIVLLAQPANLCKYAGRELSPEERDRYRADFVRDGLKSLT